MGDDQSGWKWVAITFGGLLSCGGICVCAGLLGMGGLMAGAPAFGASVEATQREGAAFGADARSDDCLSEGYTRGQACGMGIECGVMVDEYVRACLRSVPEPDPRLCDGAPAPSLTGDPLYDERICVPRGWSVESMGCITVVEALETFCAGEASAR